MIENMKFYVSPAAEPLWLIGNSCFCTSPDPVFSGEGEDGNDWNID